MGEVLQFKPKPKTISITIKTQTEVIDGVGWYRYMLDTGEWSEWIYNMDTRGCYVDERRRK